MPAKRALDVKCYSTFKLIKITHIDPFRSNSVNRYTSVLFMPEDFYAYCLAHFGVEQKYQEPCHWLIIISYLRIAFCGYCSELWSCFNGIWRYWLYKSIGSCTIKAATCNPIMMAEYWKSMMIWYIYNYVVCKHKGRFESNCTFYLIRMREGGLFNLKDNLNEVYCYLIVANINDIPRDVP